MKDEADPEDVEAALESLVEDMETPHATQSKIDCDFTLVDDAGDAPAELAIYPRETSSGLLTEWITATGEESFVNLEEMR